MGLRRFVLLSILLNVVLGLAVLIKRSSIHSGAESAAPSQASASAVSEIRARALKSRKLARPETRRLPVNWSSIADEDLNSYVRNLRSIGFPEAVVQRVIITELDRLFLNLWAKRPPGTNFWITGPQREANGAEQQRARRQLELERRDKIQELLGVEWNQTADMTQGDGFYFDLLVLVGGSPEKVNHLYAVWTRFDDLKDSERAMGEMVTADTLQQRRKFSELMVAELKMAMTPAAFEELELRMMSVDVGDVWGSESLFGCVLTGAELRELLRIKKGNSSPLAKMFQDDQDIEPTSPEEVQEQEKKIRIFLGEERYAGYQRAKDFEYRGIGREFGNIPIETTWAIYDLVRSAKTGAQELHRDSNQAETQRQLQLQRIRSEAQASLEKQLGTEKFQSYVQRNPKWLDELTRRKDDFR